MSKISHYVDLHRTSRSKFMSIADYNKKYNANLPVNKVAEAAFHADLRRKRRMMFPVRETALYPLARELGSTGEKAPRRTISRSMRRRPEVLPCGHKSKKKCDCDDTDKPVRRVGMKLSNISISRPKAAPIVAPVVRSTSTHMIDTRRAPMKAPSGHNNNDKKQRNGNKHPKGRGHERHSLGGRSHESKANKSSIKMSSVDDHGTFSASDAKAFYNKINPDFLKEHDIAEVVSNWNKAPVADILNSIRAKYGIAPKDIWDMDSVQSFYEHYDPDFLAQNNLHEVMNDWTNVQPSVLKSLLTDRYGSFPTEPFKTVNWTPAAVTEYYNEVFPAKLQQETPREIIAGWNKYSVEEVMAACKTRYGVAPTPVNYVAPQSDVQSHVELYKRQLEDSGEHFDATKILHFVPTNVAFSEFSSHATKFKASAARFLIDGVKGPYKMFNSEYKTFKSINSDDVKTVMKAVKQNKSGDFFIRVTE